MAGIYRLIDVLSVNNYVKNKYVTLRQINAADISWMMGCGSIVLVIDKNDVICKKYSSDDPKFMSKFEGAHNEGARGLVVRLRLITKPFIIRSHAASPTTGADIGRIVVRVGEMRRRRRHCCCVVGTCCGPGRRRYPIDLLIAEAFEKLGS